MPSLANWNDTRRLIPAHSLRFVKTRRHPQTRKYVRPILRITLPSDEDGASLQLTHTENLVKFGRLVFEICELAEKQDRYTNTLIVIVGTATGSEVKGHFNLKQAAVGDGQTSPGAATWRSGRNASSPVWVYYLHYMAT